MHLQSLALTRFRNYAHRDFSYCPGINLLAAPNGSGKTNMLEAIHYGCLAHSQRTRRDKELIQWGEKSFVMRLVGWLRGREQAQSVEYMESGHKRVKVNGAESRRLSDLIGHFSVVAFSPEDLDLIRSGPQERRRFLDILLCQSSADYLDCLRRYNAALKQRNALLKQMARARSLPAHLGLGGGPPGSAAWPAPRALEVLAAFDSPLAEAGSRITLHRRRALAELAPLATGLYGVIAEAREALTLALAGCVSESDDYETVRSQFLARLAAIGPQEREAGVTLAGPHREDLLSFLADKPVREYGSQGQKRSVALSLKLASARLLEEKIGHPPILLLDDVFAELDEGRRARIGELIRGRGQVFIANPRAADLPFAADQVLVLNEQAG